MKKIKSTFTYTQFVSEAELSPEQASLLSEAHRFAKRAYAPYSRFKVGAAARLKSGLILGGANQENASFPVCICAEQTVLSNFGVNHAEDVITSIAITAISSSHLLNHPVSPCGACRQSLLEYENRQRSPIEIILQGESGPVYVIEGIKELLPLSFDGGDL